MPENNIQQINKPQVNPIQIFTEPQIQQKIENKISEQSQQVIAQDTIIQNQNQKQLPEQTFIMIKPDGVLRGLVSAIIKKFEEKGYQLIALKLMNAPQDLLKQHYLHLANTQFFNGLIKYMSSGPVIAMIWQGKDIIKQGRIILGTTDPLNSNPGTIRGNNCINISKNLCHASDSLESSKKEINLWFTEKEQLQWVLSTYSQIYE